MYDTACVGQNWQHYESVSISSEESGDCAFFGDLRGEVCEGERFGERRGERRGEAVAAEEEEEADGVEDDEEVEEDSEAAAPGREAATTLGILPLRSMFSNRSIS